MTKSYKYDFWSKGRVPRFICEDCEEKFFTRVDYLDHICDGLSFPQQSNLEGVE